jgi:CDP-diacylglycerol--serine O-phosphatidyltransferase
MIRQLLDPANAITASGLALSVLGIHFVLTGNAELGVAVVLWALLADHLDGVVAMRTRRRAPETGKIGKNLDSLADLVSAGVFPAVLLLQVSGGAPAAVIVAIVLVIASALRLSYFNVFGLAGGKFIGVPTTYVVPVTAVMFLLRPGVPPAMFAGLLGAALLVVAALHVTPVRVPRTEGAMYAVVTVFAIGASTWLAMRALHG